MGITLISVFKINHLSFINTLQPLHRGSSSRSCIKEFLTAPLNCFSLFKHILHVIKSTTFTLSNTNTWLSNAKRAFRLLKGVEAINFYNTNYIIMLRRKPLNIHSFFFRFSFINHSLFFHAFKSRYKSILKYHIIQLRVNAIL